MRVVGCASEVERLKNGLSTMVHATRVILEHPGSPSAIALLVHVAHQFAGIPPSPVGNELEGPEASEVPADDEVILDPSELRPLVKRR